MDLLSKLLEKKSADKNWLAIDVGATNLRVLEFALGEEDGAVELVKMASAKTLPGAVVEEAILKLPEVTQALQGLLQKIERVDSHLPVIFGIAGEVCLSLTTNGRVIRENPEGVLKIQELRDIQKRLEESAFVEAGRVIAESTGNPDLDISLVESRITTVKADDFWLANPLGYRGRQLELGLFNSFTPTSHWQCLQSLAASLQLNLVQVASTLGAISLGLVGEKPWELNALLVDIGKDTTEVGLVFGGSVISTKVVDLGGGAFTYQLCKDLNLSEEEAERKKLDFSDGLLTGEEGEKIAASLQKPLTWWQDGLQLALADFSGVKTFPDKMYLVGGGALLPLISESLVALPWVKDLPFRSPPEVKILEPLAFPKLEDPQQFLNTADDLPAASLGFIGAKIFGANFNGGN